MRFNPPPNWPAAPQGWTPPPGWEPDPAWGELPPGWALWVDDAAPASAAFPAGQGYEQQPWSPGGGEQGGYTPGGYTPAAYSPGGFPLAGPPPTGGGGNRTLILAVAGVVVVALVAAGVVFLTHRGVDTPVAATTTTTQTPTSAAASSSSSSGSSSSGSSPRTPSSAPTTRATAPSGTLALGTSAPVGDYTVTVTAVTLDATAAVKSANILNKDPSNGRYILVNVSATYNGSATGSAYGDLFTTLAGGNGATFDDTSCIAVAPDDMVDAKDLSSGQTATGNFCLDVDPAALPGSTVTITDSSFASGPVWATGG